MRVIPPVTENGVGVGVKQDDMVNQYGNSCTGWQVGMTRHMSSVESVCCRSLKTSRQMCRTMSHIEHGPLKCHKTQMAAGQWNSCVRKYKVV